MPKQSKGGTAPKSRTPGKTARTRASDSPIIQSAESLGRLIGALRRQIDKTIARKAAIKKR